MKYSLRKLMIAVLVLPPLLAGISRVVDATRPRRRGCFGDDLGPLIPQRIIIQPEEEAKLGLNTETP
jgi:hypothetical protein